MMDYCKDYEDFSNTVEFYVETIPYIEKNTDDERTPLEKIEFGCDEDE